MERLARDDPGRKRLAIETDPSTDRAQQCLSAIGARDKCGGRTRRSGQSVALALQSAATFSRGDPRRYAGCIGTAKCHVRRTERDAASESGIDWPALQTRAMESCSRSG